MRLDILKKLSSQTGDKKQASHRHVADLCLKDSSLLKEIGRELNSNDPKLAADCAEVMTMVASSNPLLIKQYVPQLITLIHHKYNKTRWEAVHALSLIASILPDAIETILPDLQQLTELDKSTIVRDYATESIARYAGANPSTARNAFPILKNILKQWEDKQASKVLEGMHRVMLLLPHLEKEIQAIAVEYSHSSRAVVKKSATKLLKAIK